MKEIKNKKRHDLAEINNKQYSTMNKEYYCSSFHSLVLCARYRKGVKACKNCSCKVSV